MIPEATLSHFSTGRLRLRVPAMRGDAAYFTLATQQLSTRYDRVISNFHTGSVLVRHPHLTCADVRNSGMDQGLFELLVPETGEAPGNWKAVATIPDIDWRVMASLLFVGLALLQLQRGQILTPAMSMLWYAYEMLQPRHSER